MLGGLFGKKKDPLIERAETLVEAAKTFAISSYIPTLESFSILKNVQSEDWDFLVTIAGVFIGATRLNNLELGEEREIALMEIVSRHLIEWNSQKAALGFEDCKIFFDKFHNSFDPQFAAANTIGAWVVWNLLDHPPTSEEEEKLAGALGSLVVHSFFRWWNE